MSFWGFITEKNFYIGHDMNLTTHTHTHKRQSGNLFHQRCISPEFDLHYFIVTLFSNLLQNVYYNVLLHV